MNGKSIFIGSSRMCRISTSRDDREGLLRKGSIRENTRKNGGKKNEDKISIKGKG